MRNQITTKIIEVNLHEAITPSRAEVSIGSIDLVKKFRIDGTPNSKNRGQVALFETAL